MPRALLFTGRSDFASVNTMVAQLGAALAAKGWGTRTIDLRARDAVPEIVAAIRANQVDLFVCVNGLGIPTPDQGPGFYAESRAPVLGYFVDHPLYHYPTLRAPLPRYVATFPARNHLDFCRAHLPKGPVFGLAPHAAALPPEGRVRSWAERDIDVLLPASMGEDAESWRSRWIQHGPEIAARLERIVVLHDADPALPLTDAIEAVAPAPIPLSHYYSYFVMIDRYLRPRLRLEIARELIAAGVNLTICGPGWPDFSAHRNVTQRGATEVDEVFALMGRARIVLNPMPPYFGSHERPLQAAAHGAAGAAVGTMGFEPGPEPFLNLPADPRAAAAAVVAALADSDALESLAARGHDWVAAHHLWSHRAGQLLDLARTLPA